jgi:hypothetical protein
MELTKEQSLRQAIAREEANLATLEQKQQNSREQLATLRADRSYMSDTDQWN